MHARMTVAQTQPDRFDEAVELVQDAAAAAREHPGYHGFLLLTDRAQRGLVGISLWDTEADMQTSGGARGYYQERIANLIDLLVGPPTTTTHEVAVSEPYPANGRLRHVSRERLGGDG